MEVCFLVLFSLATVTSFIDPSVLLLLVTKSPKVEPLLIFSISLVPTYSFLCCTGGVQATAEAETVA